MYGSLPASAAQDRVKPTPQLVQTAGYYRLQSVREYNGKTLCLQGNGNLATVTITYCSSSYRQRWAYGTLTTGGYPVLLNTGYSGGLALDAPTLSNGTTMQLRSANGGTHQGYYWDSLGNQAFNLYLAYNHRLVIGATSATPGSAVKLQASTGVNGLQSWHMYNW